MGFKIQNNIAALNAQRSLSISESNLSKSLEKLSSGYRINSAKDDAAGLAISLNFQSDIASIKVAQRNIAEANALLQVAEGAMSSIGDILVRLKELATQAASQNVGTDIDKLSAEYDTLVQEIDRIANSTKYAGVALTDGTFSNKAFQIGYEKDTNSQLTISIDSVESSTLGIATGDISTGSKAYNALATIDSAISTLAASRSEIGAYQNRLANAASNLAITLENFTAAESTIRDVDMAAEMTNFTKNQILVQAGMSMLAQANMVPQLVLSLFR